MAAWRISIPFSTIKREKDEGVQQDRPQFQFHLVRLKGACPSLPVHKIEFQFHLVRLKVLHENNRGIKKQFQFHLVRLKGF